MLEIAIQAAGRSVTPGDLSSILGARRAYEELGDMIEALIAQMDIIAGDPDLEQNDLEDDFVLSEGAIGWDNLRGPGCEITDPGGQCDEDEVNTMALAALEGGVPGCWISDSDFCAVYDRH